MTVQAPVKEPEVKATERPWPPEQGQWTYEDWLRLPSDGWKYEVIKGVLYMVPAPRPMHQDISRELLYRMLAFVKAQRLGRVYYAPVDVFLPGQETPVQPDLLFIIRERLDMVRPDEGIFGAPDLVVEVLSPSDWYTDRKVKFALYAETGVREYWIVDPKSYGEVRRRAGRIEVYVLRSSATALRGAEYELLGRWGASEVVRSEVLPGFSVAVDEVLGRAEVFDL